MSRICHINLSGADRAAFASRPRPAGRGDARPPAPRLFPNGRPDHGAGNGGGEGGGGGQTIAMPGPGEAAPRPAAARPQRPSRPRHRPPEVDEVDTTSPLGCPIPAGERARMVEEARQGDRHRGRMTWGGGVGQGLSAWGRPQQISAAPGPPRPTLVLWRIHRSSLQGYRTAPMLGSGKVLLKT